jgi:hypothetical protein
MDGAADGLRCRFEWRWTQRQRRRREWCERDGERWKQWWWWRQAAAVKRKREWRLQEQQRRRGTVRHLLFLQSVQRPLQQVYCSSLLETKGKGQSSATAVGGG